MVPAGAPSALQHSGARDNSRLPLGYSAKWQPGIRHGMARWQRIARHQSVLRLPKTRYEMARAALRPPSAQAVKGGEELARARARQTAGSISVRRKRLPTLLVKNTEGLVYHAP